MPNDKVPTYEEVEKIIKDMEKNNQSPTVETICNALQITDPQISYAVYRHFFAWEQKQKNTQSLKKQSSSSNKCFSPEEFEKLQQSFEERTKELENSLSLVRTTLESTADGILMVNRAGKMINWNHKFVELMRIPQYVLDAADETVGLKYVFSQIENGEELYRLVTELWDHLEERGNVGEIRFKDGRILERYSQPHRVGNEVIGRVWSFRDITERRKAEEALRLRERAVTASPNGVMIFNANSAHQIIYINPAFEKITGYDESEVLGKSYDFLVSDDNKQVELKIIQNALNDKQEKQVILRSYRKDGKLFWNEWHVAPVPNADNKIVNFVGIVVDVTERKNMEDQLLYQATHDSLTNLPNRPLLLDRIQQAIAHAKRENNYVIILFLDLDFFKNINDSLGHSAGDDLLKMVGNRLRHHLREIDTLARLGGDEFVIVIQTKEEIEKTVHLAQKILILLQRPFIFDSHHITITTSIGISYYPIDGKDVETLMKNADMAMYQAKEKGRNNFQFFTPELNTRLLKRIETEEGLHRALKNNEFFLTYQPLVNLATGKLLGVEALLRWQPPNEELKNPADFVQLAEETGLIIPIGEWVLKEAIAQIKKWQALGLPEIIVSVNLSGKQFTQPNFLENIRKIIEQTKINPQLLELELTESSLMNSTHSLSILTSLHQLGLKLVVDDFGTGYSCLSYLHQFPIHKIKIDRSFVSLIQSSNDYTPIVQSIISLSKNLNLKVLAEGVETIEQLLYLRKLGCDEIQGFYVSRPVSPEVIAKLLEKNEKLL